MRKPDIAYAQERLKTNY